MSKLTYEDKINLLSSNLQIKDSKQKFLSEMEKEKEIRAKTVRKVKVIIYRFVNVDLKKIRIK